MKRYLFSLICLEALLPLKAQDTIPFLDSCFGYPLCVRVGYGAASGMYNQLDSFDYHCMEIQGPYDDNHGFCNFAALFPIIFTKPAGTRILGIAATQELPPPKPGCGFALYSFGPNTLELVDSVDVNRWCKKMRYMYRGHDETYQAVPCYIYLFDGDGITTTTDTFCVGTVGWNYHLDNPVYGYTSYYFLQDYWDKDTLVCPLDLFGMLGLYEEQSPCSISVAAYYRAWGCVFPILQLPCPAPSMPEVVSNQPGSVLFRWPQGDSAANYEVSLFVANGDSTLFSTGLITDTSFLLTDSLMSSLGLSLGNYVVRYRKECLFENGSYSTSVWSEWSDPRSFRYASPSAGIDGIEGENGVLLQPNPANNSVLLTSEVALTGIEVYTIDGAFYKRMPAAGYAVDIDVSAWPSGTYLLHVGTTDGNLTRRLVVNH